MATLNRAAFSRADVPDSKRGYPDFDLRDYATRRGLEFLDHGKPAGFRAALPGDETLRSNVLRGVLPGGEYGVMAHEGPSRSASTPSCPRRRNVRPLSHHPGSSSRPGGAGSRSAIPPTARTGAARSTASAWWAKETGDRFGLESEDPLAYHRAFPSLPVPGVGCVVLRGSLPGLGVPGRLVVHRERGAARPAVVIACPEGAEPTPPGGLVYQEHGVRLEIVDGLLAVWSIDSYTGKAIERYLDAFCTSVVAVLGSHATTLEATA
jgi:hypothetical protein